MIILVLFVSYYSECVGVDHLNYFAETVNKSTLKKICTNNIKYVTTGLFLIVKVPLNPDTVTL